MPEGRRSSCTLEETNLPLHYKRGSFLKVYFAAPIRGKRVCGEIYRKIFFALERIGCEVITPHVIDESGRAEEGLSDEEIFERDMRLIDECDVLVAEVSTPSIGVGVEIQSALDRGKRVVCLYLPEARKGVSALVLGNPKIVKIEYTPDTVEEKLWEVLGKWIGCGIEKST